MINKVTDDSTVVFFSDYHVQERNLVKRKDFLTYLGHNIDKYNDNSIRENKSKSMINKKNVRTVLIRTHLTTFGKLYVRFIWRWKLIYKLRGEQDGANALYACRVTQNEAYRYVD